MPYKCEDLLRSRVIELIQCLDESGLALDDAQLTYRDYLAKISIPEAGTIQLYYSPKRDAYTLKLDGLRDKQFYAAVESCWEADTEKTPRTEATGYQAYVDGSYLEGAVGYGAVILNNGEEIQRFSGNVTQHTEQRQVVGELAATMQVLNWCEQHHVHTIEIFYDYKGIANWANGTWKANNEATQHYRAVVKASPVKVNWHKVKSHSGNRWNDLADELAKAGALANPVSRPATADDALLVLEAKALEFVQYLKTQGIDATFTKIYNEQFARIVIDKGYFDLYNTRNRPLSPYVHNFKNKTRKAQIEHLWEQFKREQ